MNEECVSVLLKLTETRLDQLQLEIARPNPPYSLTVSQQ